MLNARYAELIGFISVHGKLYVAKEAVQYLPSRSPESPKEVGPKEEHTKAHHQVTQD